MSAFRMLGICCVTVVFLEGHVCKGQPGGEKDERGGKAIDARRKAEIIRDVNALLIEKYIFLDVAKKMKDTLSKKLSSGDYDKINDPGQFASTLGEDLFKISNDRHFHLEFNPKRARLIKAQQSKSAEEVERSNRTILEGDRLVNFGFQKIEHLGGNVGYLDLSFFSDAEAAGETAAAAMGLLANADAIIVDLRENHGGWPSMVQLLCSYFVKGTAEGRTHLNTFERRCDNSQEQFWTLAYVPGKRMFDVDLYVLTSSSTASAAEEFTYNLKNLKRATIVGEKTAGAANPIDALVVQEDFVIHLPTGRPINPISKTNWEQTGIEPHVAVPAEQALDRAYRLALEKRLQVVTEEERRSRITWAIEGLNARLNPLKVEAGRLGKYVGEYGERKITQEGGDLFYQRTKARYRLFPLKENVFGVSRLDSFRIEFVVDRQGKVTGLVGVFEDGTRDPSERTK